MAKLADNKSKEYEAYSEVKTNAITLNQYLGYEDKVEKVNYTNTRGEQLSITTDDLDKIVAIVKQLQLASPSQNVSWRKVRQKAMELEIPFSPSIAFKDLVMRRLDVISKAPNTNSGLDSFKQFNKTFGNELGDLQVRKRSIQNQSREMNKLKRKLTDKVIFRNQILDALAEPIKVISKDSINPVNIEEPNKKEDLVLVISDWHVGAVVNLTDNQYNHEIAKQRVESLTNKFMQAITTEKPANVLIVNIGDLIEGAQMRKNQAYSIDMTLGQQIHCAGELQTNLVMKLAMAFPQIKFTFTELEGNHDRFSPSKKDELPQDGISIIGRTMLKLASANLDNLEVLEPENEYRFGVNTLGHHLIFVHGDRDKLANNDILGKLSVYSSTPLDAVIGGHLHSIQIREQGHDRFVCQSGSLIGPSDYSDSLGVTSSPSQLMIKVTENELVPQIVLIN